MKSCKMHARRLQICLQLQLDKFTEDKIWLLFDNAMFSVDLQITKLNYVVYMLFETNEDNISTRRISNSDLLRHAECQPSMVR